MQFASFSILARRKKAFTHPSAVHPLGRRVRFGYRLVASTAPDRAMVQSVRPGAERSASE